MRDDVDWYAHLVDGFRRLRSPHGQPMLPLTVYEARLLRRMLDTPDHAVAWLDLVIAIYGDEGRNAPETFDSELRRIVHCLRAKFERGGWPARRDLVRNVPGYGYGIDTGVLRAGLTGHASHALPTSDARETCMMALDPVGA